jgi:hypothetical protein
MILKSETYHFHRLDLTRQAGFIVTVYDEDGLRLASTPPSADSGCGLRREAGSRLNQAQGRGI